MSTFYQRNIPILGLTLLVLSLGLAVLTQLGVASLIPVAVIWRAWPLMLIGFGLDMLLGWRPNQVWTLVGASLVLLVPLSFMADWRFAEVPTGDEQRPDRPRSFTIGTGGASAAEIDFELGAAGLQLGLLEDAGSLLLSGEVTGVTSSPTPSYGIDNGTAKLKLATPSSNLANLTSENVRWDLRLTPDLPLTLNIQARAGTLDLDLRRLQIQRLVLDSGASQATLRLPALGAPTIAITAEASTLVLEIPPDAQARITVSSGTSSITIAERFTRQGDMYTTSGWDKASERLDITINGAAASIEVR